MYVVLVLVGALCVCNAFPFGAPKGACVDMTPGHIYFNLTRVQAQTTASPYNVTVGSKLYTPGGTVKVQIVGPQFQGFLLQARHNGNASPVGSFSAAPTNTKAVQCTSENDSMTHANPNAKQNITLTWTAPSDARADITFIATVAQEKNVFWLNNTSPMVTLAKGYKKEASGNHV